MSGNAEGMAQLRAALGAEPPEGLAGLDEHTLIALAANVREAQEQQARQLREAGDKALRLVPAILRRLVRKAMFG